MQKYRFQNSELLGKHSHSIKQNESYFQIDMQVSDLFSFNLEFAGREIQTAASLQTALKEAGTGYNTQPVWII